MTPEEKRKILQERRAAKMKGGNATNRLNNILNQGNSVKSSTVTSVLDNPKPSAPAATSIKAPTPHHPNDDPDTSDIEQLLLSRVSPTPQANDMDEMLKNMFGAGAGPGAGPGAGEGDALAQMMKMMGGDSTGAEGMGQQTAYDAELLKYNQYKQKSLKYKFLLVRYVSVMVNFIYHYLNYDSFRSSSYSYVRENSTVNNQFFVIFISIEAIILSLYYMISTKRRLSETISSDNLILKGVNLAAGVVPLIQKYQPLIVQLVGYWELLGIFLGDLALVAVMFGLTSRLS